MTEVPIDDRIALQDLMIGYYYAVDRLITEEVLDWFTDDAVLDLSGVGLEIMSGKPVIGAYYEHMLVNVSHTTHYISNFAVEAYAGDRATFRAYIEGLGRMNDGNEIHGHSRGWMDCVKLGGTWKCREFRLRQVMPLAGSITEILGSGLQ
jgi:SnoaL-like domain